MAATTDLAENKLEPEPIPGATVEVSTDAVDESEVQSLPSSDAPDVEVSADVGDGDPSEREVSVVPDSKKWPGWPGHCVFRMIVPVVKVGSIIGRKGEFIKKMCEETKARIRILEGVVGTTDRIVLITAKEEPDAEFSPAMNGLLSVFRRINGIPDSEDDGSTTALQPLCSSRILVASAQAISLIGKGGVVIKSIQEGSGATVRVLPGEELPHYAVSDERIVDIQGEPLKVLKALELVVGQLRKFLVDQSIIPLFEKNLSSSITSAAQDRVVDKTTASVHGTTHTGISNDYPPPLMRDPLYYERESHLDSHLSRSGLVLYGQDPALSTQRPSGLGRTTGALVTQITQTMQIPLSYAEDIIGIGGANIAYIRRTSGAILTVQESRGLSDEITVEIKGSSSEVHTAQQLIQDFIAGHKEPAGGSYGGLDSNYMSSYSQLGSAPYSSSLPSQHGSSGRLGGYGGYRY